MEDKLKCNECGYVAKTTTAFQIHLYRWCNKGWRKEVIVKKVQPKLPSPTPAWQSCSKCSKEFEGIKKLKEHRRLCLKTCLTCLKVSSRVANSRKHELTHTKQPKQVIDLICDGCQKNFRTKGKLREHIRVCIISKPRFRNIILRFDTMNEANQWIEDIQLKTLSFFASHSGKTQDSSTYFYKYCQHNHGTASEKNSYRKTDRRRHGGVAPNYNCPAKMNVLQNQSGVTIKFYPDHNHPCSEENLKYQPFPISLRKFVAAKVAKGICNKEIYNDVKSNNLELAEGATSIAIDKRDQLTTRYISNVRSKLKKRYGQLPVKDATLTDMQLQTLSRAACKTVFETPVLLPETCIKKERFDNCEVALYEGEYFSNSFNLGSQTVLSPAPQDEAFEFSVTTEMAAPKFVHDEPSQAHIDLCASIKKDIQQLDSILTPQNVARVPKSVLSNIQKNMTKWVRVFQAHALENKRTPLKEEPTAIIKIKAEVPNSEEAMKPRRVIVVVGNPCNQTEQNTSFMAS